MKSMTFSAVIALALSGAWLSGLGSDAPRVQAAETASGEAHWIWAPRRQNAAAAGTCFFRKVFNVAHPESGRISISCDDHYELYVNSRKVGTGDNWRELRTYDITPLLLSGRNVVAIKAANVTGDSAGLVARVVVKQVGGTDVSYSTSGNWRVALQEESGWARSQFNDSRWTIARSFGEFGRAAPWGDQVRTGDGSHGGRFQLPKDFRVELVTHPEDTGSLIAMSFNEWGEIVAAREGGPLLLIQDEDKDGTPEAVSVFCKEVVNCQGILPLNGYIFAIGDGPEGAGLYRVTDEDLDGTADVTELCLKFKGKMAEHGPHGLTLGPDGMIYITVGNHSAVEKEAASSSPLRHSYEGDLVQPRYEDAGADGPGIAAPGGTIVRTDLECTFVETYAGGLRNAYDLVFNQQGDLFTYDADMELDAGLPWYMPTRIGHVLPGADFGWRSGWAKWPAYYLDSLPGILETGRGSPTGVEYYGHDQFPVQYHNALFACDWSRGRILAVHMKPSGGTYACTSEVFVQGQPLNVTDLAVGPDGWLYFSTGGRGTEGGVYRVVWTGPKPPIAASEGIYQAIYQPQPNSAWSRERIATIKEEMGAQWKADLLQIVGNASADVQQRLRALDCLQLYGPSPTTGLLVRLARDPKMEVRAKAAYLMGLHSDELTQGQLLTLLTDSSAMVRRTACESLTRSGQAVDPQNLLPLFASDRFVAWSARRALEEIAPDQWRQAVLSSPEPRVFLQGATALLMVGTDRPTIDAILTRSSQLMSGYLRDQDFIDLLRVIELALYRGEVTGEEVPQLRTQLAEEYPSLEPRINRELIRLLVHLQDATAADRMVAELNGSGPQVEKMHLAAYARLLHAHWNTSQKLALMGFYEAIRATPEGSSHSAYLNSFTREYVAHLSPAEQQDVLDQAAQLPSAALSVLARLPEHPDEEVLQQLMALDLDLRSATSTASRQLTIGIVAVLARSQDPQAMEYLRDVFERQPDRRMTVAMGLSQSPGGENWPLLIRALPLLEGGAAQEVLASLPKANEIPDKPEPLRQVILCGLRLGESGGREAVAVLEKWTGEKVSQPEDSWDVALAAWQSWFSSTYPDQPEPKLPQDSGDSHWAYEVLLSHLTGDRSTGGDAERGRIVFHKAQCSKCHRSGLEGDRIGPDLTTISQRFHTKEILESIVYPSHVISDQYASQTIVTVDGVTYTGIVVPSGSDAMLVLQSNGQKTVVRNESIEEIAPDKRSAMPDGLLNSLTLEEIGDLFAFLAAPPRPARQARAQ